MYYKEKTMNIEKLKKLVEELQEYLPFYGKILSIEKNKPDSPLGRIDKLILNKYHLMATIVQERINKKGQIYDKPAFKFKITINKVENIFPFKTKDGENIIL